jgi:hypothetical protein
MSQLPFVATTNKICEAYGCDNRATTQIEIQVGKLGAIPLNLCIECVSLFEGNQDKNRELSNNSKEMIGGISHQPTEERMQRSKLIPKQTTLEELL